jgi:hypothetical protein
MEASSLDGHVFWRMDGDDEMMMERGNWEERIYSHAQNLSS